MTAPPDIQGLTDAVSILRCLHAERRGEPAPGFAIEGMNEAFGRIGILKAGVVRAQLSDVLDMLEGTTKPLPPDEPETFDDRQAYEFYHAVRREKRLFWALFIAVGISAAFVLGVLSGGVPWP
jgi:hypothetical protein